MAANAKPHKGLSLGFGIPRIKFQIKVDMYDPAKYIQEEVLHNFEKSGGERHYLGIVGAPAMKKLMFKKLSSAKIKYIATMGDVEGMERKKKLVCASTAQLLESCTAIITCFDDAEECKELFNEATEAAATTTFVDFSAVDVETAKELGAMAGENGHVYLDCGLTGRQFKSNEERDTIFCGAEQQHYVELKPLLQTLAHRVRYMGDVGSGRAAKAIIDTVQGAYTTAVSEALMLSDSLGMDAIKMMRNIRINADPGLHVFEDMVADKNFEPLTKKGREPTILAEYAASAATTAALADESGIEATTLKSVSATLEAATAEHGGKDINAVYLALGGGGIETARGEGEEDN